MDAPLALKKNKKSNTSQEYEQQSNNTKQKIYLREKTAVTDSTESNSANHKISQSNDQSKDYLNVSDENRDASQEKSCTFERVIDTINKRGKDLRDAEPLSPTTPTSVTEIAKMRIKRNLNFNRNGTTEQPQMRSSKY